MKKKSCVVMVATALLTMGHGGCYRAPDPTSAPVAGVVQKADGEIRTYSETGELLSTWTNVLPSTIAFSEGWITFDDRGGRTFVVVGGTTIVSKP